MQSYREFVGWPEGWDILSAMQFNLLTYLGLKENHDLLDIGSVLFVQDVCLYLISCPAIILESNRKSGW
jgi:hypothetical protein